MPGESERPPYLRALPTRRADPDAGALADPKAERAVLAAVLLDERQAGATYERVRRIVRCGRTKRRDGRFEYHGDFAEARHNILFACMGAVLARGLDLDVITLTAELAAARGDDAGGLLNTVGGAQYVGELSDEIPTTAHVESHARIVAECAAARRFVEACGDARSLVLARGSRGLAEAVALVAAARVERQGKAARTLHEIAESAWDDYADVLDGRRRPVPTGFRALDGDERAVGLLAGGFHRRELIVVAADQAGGKTAWALQCLVHAARGGAAGLLISQEMSGESLHWRMACGDARVEATRVRSGRLNQDDVEALQRASAALVDLDLRVIDAGCNVEDIRVAALACQAERPLHVVVVDYLQILDAPEDAPDKAHEVIDRNALAMKRLARELDCPVVLLSQFNRSGQNAGRKPRIQDLKGSGGIESHADVILVLHPVGGRVDGPQPSELPVELLVLKNRNGPTESVSLVFERALTRFREVVVTREGAVPPSYPDELDMPEGA